VEEETREVVTSKIFDFIDLPSIHEYGTATFGIKLADSFIEEIYSLLDELKSSFYFHPECRYLETKSKKYRNIILGSYLIIYRIKSTRIEVLRAFHSSHSPKIYKDLKKIKL